MSENPVPTFSKAEAQALIDTAASAPLQNLSHSRSVEALLSKFLGWYNHVTAPPAEIGVPEEKAEQTAT